MTTFADLKDKIDLDAISYPTHCPECGTETVIDNNMPFCPNFTCAGRIYGRVLKYVEILDIKGVGEEAIRGLVAAGHLNHPADLYTITEEQFTSLERKGPKHFKKLQDGLSARRVLDFHEFMGALSIDEASVGTFLSVAKGGFDCLEKLENSTPESLATCDNVTTRKAEVMLRGLNGQIDQVRRMVDQHHIEFRKIEIENAITGLTVCLTGSLSKPRKHYQDLIKASGGYVGSSVGRKTHVLVAANPESNSGKMKKARDLGIEVIGEDELSARLSYPRPPAAQYLRCFFNGFF